MDLSDEVLKKLKCDKCNGYLSSAPVHITKEMKVICGTCSILEEEETIFRMVQYEAVANLLKFPCKYQNDGCKKTIEFNNQSTHEFNCKYHQIVCPVMPSESCEWTGRKTDLYKHVQDKHPEHLLENSCNLSHNITQSSENSFLLLAFNVLFLLHTKICVTTRKIYHSVQHFGDPNLASKYSFTLSINRDTFHYSRDGKVVSEQFQVIQRNASVETSINALLEMMDGCNGTIFNIVVKKLVDEEEDWNKEIVILKCGECLDGKVFKRTYYTDNSWWCISCSPEYKVCENKHLGCAHMDIPDKCHLHETVYCKYRTNCIFCAETLNEQKLLQHYILEHSDVTCRASGEWYITFDNISWKRIYIAHDVGDVLFCYRKNNSIYEIAILTASSPSYSLYNCILHITDPITTNLFVKKMNVEYNDSHDYKIQLEAKDFQSNKLLIKLDITKA